MNLVWMLIDFVWWLVRLAAWSLLCTLGAYIVLSIVLGLAFFIISIGTGVEIALPLFLSKWGGAIIFGVIFLEEIARDLGWFRFKKKKGGPRKSFSFEFSIGGK